MIGPNIIFFLIFLLPLVAFLIWLMRQDKRKGIIGIVIVAILVIIGVAYTFITKEAAQKVQQSKTGTIIPRKDT